MLRRREKQPVASDIEDSPAGPRRATSRRPYSCSRVMTPSHKRTYVQCLFMWMLRQPKPRVDIQAAFTVISRRGSLQRAEERRSQFSLDLRRCNLRNIEAVAANLDHANFHQSDLSGANLRGASMLKVSMRECTMQTFKGG